MQSVISHLRYTIRQLLKSPGFTVMAVLILGLGIGANTAIFSLVNGVLLRPLPYPRADRLFSLVRPFKTGAPANFDYPDFAGYCAAQHSFSGITAFSFDQFNFRGRNLPEQIDGLYVSGSFFKVLGRPFVLGQPFDDTADRPYAAAVVVLSEHLWRTHFNSDPTIIGTNIVLNSRNFQVVGVTPGQVDENYDVQVYVPMNQDPDFARNKKTYRGAIYYSCVGRLKDGVTPLQAQADLEVICQNLAATYPATDAGFGIRIAPYLDGVVSGYASTVWPLGVAVACLLAITCANVANLLLARCREKLWELNIRAALGADRFRLIAQLLTESILLSLGGGVIGLGVASWALQAIKNVDLANIPRLQEVGIDCGSLLFVFGLVLLTSLAAGLAPAWIGSKANLALALKQEGDRTGTAGPRRQRGQVVLATMQVALSCLLLTGAGLLVRSLQAIEKFPLGFKTDHVLTAEVFLADARYSDQTACNVFLDTLLERVRQLPGVISVAVDDALPFTGAIGANAFGIVGQPDPPLKDMPVLRSQIVSADCFRTLGIPLLRGRLFDRQDRPDSEKVVVVSDSFAKRFFPGQDPIGKQIHDFSGRKPNIYTIVGVVPVIQHDRQEFGRAPFQSYFLYSQSPYAPRVATDFALALHTKGDPYAMVHTLRQAVAELDPNLPLANIDSLDHVIQHSLSSRRLQMTLVGLFSAAALVLAVVGLYGVLSYSVSLRKRELGLRMALGAQRSEILALVVHYGLKIASIGLIIGFVAALVLNRLIEGMLFDVSPADPITFAASALILGLGALLACFTPALRATRIDPITALRE
jgi:putative ABC transport system permease protein